MKNCENIKSEQQISGIIKAKTKKAKVSIATSIVSYVAFLVSVISMVLTFVTNLYLEAVFLLMSAILFVSSIVSVVCSSSALLKVNKEQLLEGKRLRFAKVSAVMSYVSLGVCFFCLIAYFIIVAYAMFVLSEGILAFIEFFLLLFGS